MLPIEQIIPFIRHEDPFVVDLAMRCLAWVRWPQRLTGDFVLDAVRDGHKSLSTWLSRFEPSATVLEYAIASLSGRKSDREGGWPYGVIARAADALFTPAIIDAMRNARVERPWFAEQIRLRSDMAAWPTQRLREELLAACHVADEEGSCRSEQHEINAITDRLVYRGDSVDWAADELGKRLGSNDWAEIWLLAMLIKSRHQPALDMAIGRWPATNPDDNESLTLECGYAISELATPADLPRIAGLWETLHPRNWLYLIEAVGRLRLPEAEPIVLDFAKRTDEADLKTFAAIGLCEMLCTGDDARQFIRDLVEAEAFDFEQVDLEELAIPLGIITRRPFPEDAAWRTRLSDPLRSESRRAAFAGRYPQAAELMEIVQRLRESRVSKDAADMKKLVAASSSPRPAPLARAQKAGRNDPCPCGSGKKYKKCCLNKISS
jgi:hypothetical protein